jgi:hypothetical protein
MFLGFFNGLFMTLSGGPVTWFHASPVGAVLFGALNVVPLVAIFRRRATLTEDTLILSNLWRTNRLPLRDITGVGHGAVSNYSFFDARVWVTSTNGKTVNSTAFGWKSEHVVPIIKDAVHAAGGRIRQRLD